MAENSSSATPIAVETVPTAAGINSLHRVRRRPTWMQDYEVTGIDNLEDPITHFALFSDYDPTTFKTAVKEEKWRKAMDVEIDAIERNDT